jgi:hypothetical protein
MTIRKNTSGLIRTRQRFESSICILLEFTGGGMGLGGIRSSFALGEWMGHFTSLWHPFTV